MTTTQNLKLNKPNADDFYIIDVQNENMDIIDMKISENEGKVNTAEKKLLITISQVNLTHMALQRHR